MITDALLVHWHPVLRARDLGRRPRAVTVCDTDIVVYRTAAGRLAALIDQCPHRRMQLSSGWVEGERLVCPYHGFAYDPDGCGHSPATPQLRLSARAFEVVERHGVIWVRARGAATAFPGVERAGFRPVGVLADDIRCPVEPLIDNFSEVEHTPTTHALLGYARDSLPHIETRHETTERTVRVVNRGPQKPVPRFVERMFRIRSGDLFIDDWTIHFSPLHIIYHQYWEDPATGARRPDALHIAVFFTPIDRDETRMITLVATNHSPWGRLGLDRLLEPLIMRLVHHEVQLDRRMVERLADPDPDLRGTRLGRFDAPLREHRKRIATLYYETADG